MEPVLSPYKPRNGCFLRAESFFNIASDVDGGGIFAPDLSLYGGVSLHEQSHGESFLALAATASAATASTCSTSRRRRCRHAARSRCWRSWCAQRVRARSSSSPRTRRSCWPTRGARIYELDEGGIEPCAYDELEAVRLTRGFLGAPDRFIRAALEDPQP